MSGLGDIVAGAWYRGGSPPRWSWTANRALSIPTGATRRPRFRDELVNGSLVPLSRLQRGTGTWIQCLVSRRNIRWRADAG